MPVWASGLWISCSHDEALQSGKLVNCDQARGKEYRFIWRVAIYTFAYLNIQPRCSRADRASQSKSNCCIGGNAVLTTWAHGIERIKHNSRGPCANWNIRENPHVEGSLSGQEVRFSLGKCGRTIYAMSRVHPKCFDSAPSDHSVAAPVLVRQEPDLEEDEEEDEGDSNEGDDEEGEDGYSE